MTTPPLDATTRAALDRITTGLRGTTPRDFAPEQAAAMLTAAATMTTDAPTATARINAAAEHVGTTTRTWTPAELADLLDAPTPPAITGQVVSMSAYRTDGTQDRTDDDTDNDDQDENASVDGRVIFHPTATTLPWEDPTPRRDVLPTWLRDAGTARAAARWAAAHVGHVCAFHTVRLPFYWARLAKRSHRGAYRVTAAVTRWTLDTDSANVRRALAAAADRTTYDLANAATYVRLEEQRRTLVRNRVALTSVFAAVAVVAAFIAWVALPTWAFLCGVGLLLAVLGLLGAEADQPILSRSVDTESTPRLTSELILTALGSLGIAELNKHLRGNAADGVRFPTPISRDGAGWRADIDLPPGVTAGDVAERRDRLASGLRRPVGCVWPEGDAETHAGRLVLWVGDKPLNKAKPAPWPLAAKGAVNVFESFPFGTDPRGRTVRLNLMFASGLIGAVPRVGKTFTARTIALAAALDPRCEMHLFDLKGGADWLPLEPVAHAFRVGDDPEDHAYILRDAHALREDMTRRYKTLRGLPREVCPEGKITDALASDKTLGLHPVFWHADECQALYAHPDHGTEYAEIMTDLAKRGPAVGIMVWNSTQRPTADSVPTGLAAVAVLRFCLKVAGQLENDVILGTSAYKNGIRATMFSRADKGIGYLVGEGEDAQIVRTAYVDGPTAERITTRACTARLAAGRLTGHALGLDPTESEEHPETILGHLLAVWPAGQERVWCETLAERLAETYPNAYAGWAAEDVTNTVKPYGLTTGQIKRHGLNRRGLDLAEVLRAHGHTDDAERPEAG